MNGYTSPSPPPRINSSSLEVPVEKNEERLFDFLSCDAALDGVASAVKASGGTGLLEVELQLDPMLLHNHSPVLGAQFCHDPINFSYFVTEVLEKWLMAKGHVSPDLSHRLLVMVSPLNLCSAGILELGSLKKRNSGLVKVAGRVVRLGLPREYVYSTGEYLQENRVCMCVCVCMCVYVCVCVRVHVRMHPVGWWVRFRDTL